jgi:hypothetical protein
MRDSARFFLIVIVVTLAGTRAGRAAEAPATSVATFDPGVSETATHLEPKHLIESGSFFLEEDAFNIVRGSDRNYTGGGAISFSGDFVRRAHLEAPIDLLDWPLARHLYRWIDRNEVEVPRVYEFSFGVTVFTPKDLQYAIPPAPDRPYAALDFLHVSHMSYSARTTLFSWLPPGLAFSTDFTVGMLGLQQGHDLQAFIHRTMRTDKNQVCNPDNLATEKPFEPCGWGRQISAGGEPTLLYGATAKKLLVERRWFDAAATARAEVGYYVDAAFGGEFRLGVLDSPWWRSNKTPLGIASMANGAGQPRRHPLKWFEAELYLFGGARGKAVAYNALLEGQFKSNPVTVTATPLLYEFETGATLNLWAFSLTYIPFAGRSADFSGDAEGLHTWTSFFFTAHSTW